MKNAIIIIIIINYLISLATCIFNVVDFASLQGAFCNFVFQVLPTTSSLRINGVETSVVCGWMPLQ